MSEQANDVQNEVSEEVAVSSGASVEELLAKLTCDGGDGDDDDGDGGAVTKSTGPQPPLRLVLNLTKWGGDRNVFMDEFPSRSDEFFADSVCYHADNYPAAQTLLKAAVEAFPDDAFEVIPYPPSALKVESIADQWQTCMRRSFWPAVDELKVCIRGCNRPLTWKMLMCMEVENLAIKQKLDSPHQSSKLTTDTKKNSDEDINVFDQIVAMCLERQSRLGVSESEHYSHLSERHLELRRLWLKDFGAMPPESIWRLQK